MAALGSYLQSAGERVVLVQQNIFRAEGPLQREGFLGSKQTAVLREALPDWDVVGISVAPTEVRRLNNRTQPATGFGLDEGWPEVAGYLTTNGTGMELADKNSLPVVYLGDRLARNLFGDGPAVGEPWRLRQRITMA